MPIATAAQTRRRLGLVSRRGRRAIAVELLAIELAEVEVRDLGVLDRRRRALEHDLSCRDADDPVRVALREVGLMQNAGDRETVRASDVGEEGEHVLGG